MKNSSKKEKAIPRVNLAFAKLVNDNGNQTQAAALLGFSSQNIGKYMKGTAIPVELIAACRKKYGYDLIELADMDFENIVLKKKESFDRIVSHETKAPLTDEPLTLELWGELKSNNRQFHKTREDDIREKSQLLKQNGDLIEIFRDLTRGGAIPHKS